MLVDLSSAIITNAEGEVKTLDDARKLLRVETLTRITLGSYTIPPRPGNLGTTYYYDPASRTAYNSKGLGNRGEEEVLSWLPAFRDECHEHGKELAASVAGFSPEEYGHLAERFSPHVDVLIANTGCGNVWKDNEQKPIPSYHPQLFKEVLEKMGPRIHPSTRFSLKISPAPNEIIEELAEVILGTGFTHEIIAVNTLPNQHGKRDDGTSALAFRETEGAEVKHIGGMSGAPLKEHGLRVIGLLGTLLPLTMPLIGCGGIRSGRDLVDYFEKRAAGGAIGVGFFEEGPRIFGNIVQEALEIVDRR